MCGGPRSYFGRKIFFTTLIFSTLALVSASADTNAPARALREQMECGDRVEMGTSFKICLTISSEQLLAARVDITAALNEIKRINAWMSDWLPETDLSKVNAGAGVGPVKVRKELIDVLKETLAISKASHGALDPTFNVMWGLYNFKSGSERQATEEELKKFLPLIDWKRVQIDEKKSTVFLPTKGMRLGLGAVGQSYAADQAVEMLKARGYSGGYVDGSGDTVFWGHKPGGALWTIGVRDPRNSQNVLMRIYGTDFAVTTAGDDEKFFVKDGQRVHHILDPLTGKPSLKSRQVTVVAKRGFDADAWDTAAFVLGPQKATPILESLGLRAVMVDEAGKLILTKGFAKRQTPWGEGYILE